MSIRLSLPSLAILCAVAAGAAAQDAPRRKSGLWEISMTSAQMPAPMVARQCVDEKTDDLARPPSRGGKEMCSKQSIRREGAGFVLESVCQVEGSTATSRGLFSGDFGSAYKGEMTTRFNPPLHGMAETKMTFRGRLLGPCAPGQKPGAVTMQDMPGGSPQGGGVDLEQARRMAEEMMKKYQK